jgi:hypothetical protein
MLENMRSGYDPHFMVLKPENKINQELDDPSSSSLIKGLIAFNVDTMM